MKKIKLTLNKETIAKLEDAKLDAVKGGDVVTNNTCQTCYPCRSVHYCFETEKKSCRACDTVTIL